MLARGRLTLPRGAPSRRAGEGRYRALRRLAHALAIVAGWVLFYWGWQRVLAGSPDFAELRLLVIGAAIVVPVVTVSWILHNRGIHKRKGPRRRVAEARLDYRLDFHGREVVADWGALEGAQRVDIVVEGERKKYIESGDTRVGGGIGGDIVGGIDGAIGGATGGAIDVNAGANAGASNGHP